jgi:methionine synthase II (cobalamin-independent)
MAGTDCGFETFMGFGNLSRRVAKEKLRSAAAGAELANQRLM